MKNSMIKIIFIGCVILALPLSADTGKSLDPNAKKVIGYFISWGIYGRNYTLDMFPSDKVTHINYAFAKVVDKKIVLADPWADTQKSFGNEPKDAPYLGNFYQLNLLKKKRPDLQILISVGGWTLSDGFSKAIETSESRKKFVDSCVDFVQKYGFDGIDFDWEYPVKGGMNDHNTPDDYKNFPLMLSELRAALDKVGTAKGGKHYLLTAAMSAGIDTFTVSYDLPALNKSLDFFNLMTYDFHVAGPGLTGHQAPLFSNPKDPSPKPEFSLKYNINDAVLAYLKAGIPANKIVVGLPIYGRGWEGVGAKDKGLFQLGTGPSKGQWEAGNYDWDDIMTNHAAKDGSNVFWDDAAKASFLYDADQKLFISFDTLQATSAKLDYILEKGLGGAMYWEPSGDRKNIVSGLIAKKLLGK